MKLALCVLVLVAACSSKKKHDETPAPTPPPPAPADAAGPLDAPPPPPPCITVVDITAGHTLDVAALKATAASCAGANVLADQTMKYGELMKTFDTLVAQGFTNLSVGEPAQHAKAQLPAGTTRSSTTNEGRIVGRFEEKPAGEIPIVVLGKRVTVLGQEIGAVEDPGLSAAISKALPAATAGHSLVLQADATTTVDTISKVVAAADDRGYTNILFGMTKKK
jgi:biopolymer transport protein ExbD